MLLVMPDELTDGQTRPFIELSLTAKRGRKVRFITKVEMGFSGIPSRVL